MTLNLPPLEDVERRLALASADRDDLPGLYRLNVVRVPAARMVAFALALLLVIAHNRAVLGGVVWPSYLAAAGVILAYCVLSWVALRLFFTRMRRVHLGTVFVWADLLPMTAIVYVSGGEQSLLWPIYFVRVADQIWIGRGRAAALALGGLACYAALLLWMGMVEGRALDGSVEAVKLLALAAMSTALAAAAAQPWDVRQRATGARDLIMQLESQSLELHRERERAEAANRAKSDFLARMSHELRTPLNSVVGFTNVLLRRAEGREREYLGRIRENGLHLLGLIDDILDLSRVEAGGVEIERVDVDLGELVRGTVHQLEGRTLGGEVELACDVPLQLAPLRADEARLRQVLVNLVGNALKFTVRGRVDVVVEADGDGRTPARLHVRDTGIGIEPERLAHIFHPFEQADGTISRKFGGAGLGLAVSRSLCELMGFELSVASEPGEGSVFTVSFRSAAAMPPTARPA